MHYAVVRRRGSRAISPWALGPRTLSPRTLSPKYFKSQGPVGRGPKILRISGPRPLGPWDLGYLGPKVGGPKVCGHKAQGPDVWPGFCHIQGCHQGLKNITESKITLKYR